METLPTPDYPERMNSFMTTEHFTLQAARGAISAEIMSRVNIYFTTLSSLIIAGAFVAQIPEMEELFALLAGIAFPVLILLGFFTLARLMVLGHLDFIYIRAINRIRHFYVQAAPEMRQYLLFPPYDDDGSTHTYGGYATGFRGNLLSAAHAVAVTNSIVTALLLSALISRSLEMTALAFLPYGLLIAVAAYIGHGLLGSALARLDYRPEYRETRFPAPLPDPPPDSTS